MLETLVAEGGPGDWEKKAQALGTGRTAKSLANKWSRRSQAAKPSPKPEMPRGMGQWGTGQSRGQNWSKDEVAKLAELVRRDGAGRWVEKAAELGTGRTGAALSQKWLNRKERPDSDGLASRDRSGLGTVRPYTQYDRSTTYHRTPWSINEDHLLRKAVMAFRHAPPGRQDILFSAAMVPGRSAKQCRERWRNHVDPSISREPWSEEENALLLRLYEQHDGKWCEISVAIPGRPDEA